MADNDAVLGPQGDTNGGDDQQQGGGDNDKQGGDAGGRQQQQQAEGEGAPHWSEELPENYREAVKGFESFEALQNALKGPEIPDAYTAPEGVEKETFEAFGKIAKEAKLTQAQVEALAKFDLERAASMPERIREQTRAELAKMQAELGADKYSTIVKSAQSAVRAFGDKETWDFFDASGLGNHPALVKLFARIGERIAEDGGSGGSGNVNLKQKSAAEILFASPTE